MDWHRGVWRGEYVVVHTDCFGRIVLTSGRHLFNDYSCFRVYWDAGLLRVLRTGLFVPVALGSRVYLHESARYDISLRVLGFECAGVGPGRMSPWRVRGNGFTPFVIFGVKI